MDVSSSHPSQTTFDVFLSFSRGGEDDGSDFTELLYETLCGLGVVVFKHENHLSVGDNFSENTAKVIEESKCSIVVLSKGYASSKWCLRELAKIIDRRDKMAYRVFPVFYYVDPIDVRYQSGIFKTSFDEHEKALSQFIGSGQKEEYIEEVQQWREAMTKISNHTHVVVSQKYFEMTSIKRVTKNVFDTLHHLKFGASNRYLVGMEPHLSKMKMLFGSKSKEVRFIGIVGMGGIGKTTMAEVLYDMFAPKFSNSCFLRVVGRNLVWLQQQLLSQLLLRKDIKIWDENQGVSNIQRYLSRKRVLIVLDGINEKRQLQMLAGSLNWFGSWSRVIITTRNKDILREPNYKDRVQEYDVKVLGDTNAFSLFCKHAFGDDRPPDENLRDLCNDIIEKVGTLPLALIKIASSLYGQCVDMWEEMLKGYHKFVYENLFFDILKTSYEELEADTQQIFLDLACFFNGEKVDRVIEILKGFGYSSPHTKLQLLADRCLIDISDEHIQMHILIICMGREIVHRELTTHQGKQKQSRIWLREDVGHAFHEKYELKYIQGIMLDLDEEEELVLEAKSFTDMTELKVLQINDVHLSEDIEFLSNRLTLLNWSGYPSKYLPSNFQPPPLLELHLPSSNVERLWNGRKKFENLKEIDVSDSRYLVEIPDFSEVPNLRRLILRNCGSLQEVHCSVNSLEHLVLLDLEGCVNFKRFSSPIYCKRLKTLVLSNSGLKFSPEFGWLMECFIELHMDGTFIHELSPSITNLIRLVLLNLKNCIRLSSLPNAIGSLRSLRTLILNGCTSLEQIPESMKDRKSLEELDIGGTSISHAPTVIPSLENLRTLNCEKLKSNIWHSLAGLSRHFGSLKDLNLSACNLEDKDIPNDLRCFSSLEILDLSCNHFVWLSESLQPLIYLRALYLNDCNKLLRLPRLPSSLLLYVGGQKFFDTPRNSQGSSANTSNLLSCSLEISSSNHENLLPYQCLHEDFSKDIRSLSYSIEVDRINDMGKQCYKLVPPSKTLVGIENQLEKVCNLLDLERSDETHIVGFFGLSGIGKTSIAEVVYDTIADKFEHSCFLYISKQNNVVSLQHQMLSQLLSKEITIRNEDHGEQVIKDNLKNSKVLIVLDGVEETRQVEKLTGSPNWFAPGSRVIITSTNRDILHQPNYKDRMQEYNVELLSHESAYLLFCKHAFGDNRPNENDLCNEIVKKVGRLPLALRTIGSFLHGKDLDVWKETLKRLSKVEEHFFDKILQRHRKNLH